MEGSLRSPDGGIQVRTTERGLPIALKLDQRELSKPPAQLAREILLLCELSAKRMQVVRRRSLIANGFSPAVVHDLNLSTEEELVQAESQLRDDDPDGASDTGMRVV
ncbi:hypothetical protein A5624_10235 [Mycobacterium sp. 1482292.6]|uniref:hypothetical protein n=1 Tax=unclassified Mycobacterium TaxID=2642494 RepID=UPI00080096A1|nr:MULTISPECIES: hypothetical protein [unclassified Mycobacterium]OBJ12630.1 hypothetical protein A5624_10235 [Mycobacterium sp. 1482292.6]OBJ19714.1 hypothetical protein A5622_20410 [Mycobacterium sp. 1245801.1]